MCLDNAFPVELSCFPAISATQELFSPRWYVTPPPLLIADAALVTQRATSALMPHTALRAGEGLNRTTFERKVTTCPNTLAHFLQVYKDCVTLVYCTVSKQTSKRPISMRITFSRLGSSLNTYFPKRDIYNITKKKAIRSKLKHPAPLLRVTSLTSAVHCNWFSDGLWKWLINCTTLRSALSVI